MVSLPSENESIPFECDNSYDSTFELIKYVFQVCYLSINLILNLMILRVFIFSKNKIFRESPFFLIYAADLIMVSVFSLGYSVEQFQGIYMSISEIFVGRLFIYVISLCPILAPFFFSPSIFLKTFFILSHYSQGFKTVSQVFLSFNRMTSVIFPVSYQQVT